ncbi:hypothetical protein LR032_04955, partial [Candidatus Bipolaricaulota bacterium]|nr:hypothetical protein [Candidatus Bipolaricaulota bacterium]
MVKIGVIGRKCKGTLLCPQTAPSKRLKKEAKIVLCEEEEATPGKKNRGWKPKGPGKHPDPKAKANLTDPDRRIRKDLQRWNLSSNRPRKRGAVDGFYIA